MSPNLLKEKLIVSEWIPQLGSLKFLFHGRNERGERGVKKRDDDDDDDTKNYPSESEISRSYIESTSRTCAAVSKQG